MNHRDLIEAILACAHERSGDWCIRCGSICAPDGEWILPELVAAMLERSDEADELLHASASSRRALERLSRGGDLLEDAIRLSSGPTCALLVVSGLAHIVDGEGPRSWLRLTERGQREAEHWGRVRGLERRCVCGHDRGEHATTYPGACACGCVAFSDAEAVAMIGELANPEDDDFDQGHEPAPVVDLVERRERASRGRT